MGRHASVGPSFGPPPKAGKLRYAYLQTMGTNAIPRSAPHADLEGGKITVYRVDRPHSSQSTIASGTMMQQLLTTPNGTNGWSVTQMAEGAAAAAAATAPGKAPPVTVAQTSA